MLEIELGNITLSPVEQVKERFYALNSFDNLLFYFLECLSKCLSQPYLLHFECEFNKDLLQLFVDEVDGKLFKLIALLVKEKMVLVFSKYLTEVLFIKLSYLKNLKAVDIKNSDRHFFLLFLHSIIYSLKTTILMQI